MQIETDGYKPSQEVADKFSSRKFVVIAGPAAAGKDTLRDGLLSQYPDIYQNIVSVTTRAPRPEEVEGKTYHFVSNEKMKEMFEAKTLLQIALVHDQQISGLDVRELDNLDSSKIGLSILVVQTELQLYEINSNIKTIFLIPPSYGELMKRLEVERLTKHHEVKRRLKAAISELEIALNNPRYFCIISDEKQRVIIKAHNFLSNGVFDEAEDKSARSVIKKILEDLRLSKVS